MRSYRSISAILVLGIVVVGCSRDHRKLARQALERGDAFVSSGNYAEALIEYRKAVQEDSNFGEARFKLAASYEAADDVRNALREYVRAADLMPKNVEAQLRAGAGLLESGQFPEAKARALQVLEIDNKNTRALVLFGNSLAAMKDLDGAITRVQEAIDANPREILTYANMGALELAKGNRAAAEGAFRRAVEIEPKSVPAHLALGNYYWSSGNREKAEGELKIALQLDPKSLIATRALAVLYSVIGKPSETELYLKKYASLTPQLGAQLSLVDFYIANGKYKEARASLNALAATNDGYVAARLRLAALDFLTNSRPRAFQQLDEALKRAPRDEGALLEKGRFLLTEQKSGDALTLANKVLERNPSSAPAFYLKAVSLKGTAPDEAIKAFQDVLRLQPGIPVVLVQLAETNLIRGDAVAAEEFAGEAARKQPSSGLPHVILAKAMLREHKLTQAEREIQGLLKANPNSSDIQTMAGELYLLNGDYRRARSSFERAVQLEPDDLEAFAGLIHAKIAQNDRQDIHSQLDSRLAKSPDDERLLLFAGTTYLALGDQTRAESLYRHVIEVNPASFDGYNRLGALYASHNRLDEAKAEYEQITLKQPKAAASAATMVGAILQLQNKPREARTHYEHALALDPQMPVAANNLAWDYAENGGNLDVALSLAQTAKAKLPNVAMVNDTLGWVYYKKGLNSLAVTSFEDATRQAPSDPSIRYRLGLAYLKAGDSRKAKLAFEEALKMNAQFKEAADAKKVLATIRS